MPSFASAYFSWPFGRFWQKFAEGPSLETFVASRNNIKNPIIVMSYFINSVEEDQCVVLSYEGEMPPLEASAARYEATGVLDQRRWKRMVVDVTQLRSIPTRVQLFDFARSLSSRASPRMRVALVVRPEQAPQAKLVEKVARNDRVFLTYFLDPEQATAWIKGRGLGVGRLAEDGKCVSRSGSKQREQAASPQC